MNLHISLRGYDRSRRVEESSLEIPVKPGEYARTLGEDLCSVRVRLYENGTGLHGEAVFTFRKPTALASSVAVGLRTGAGRITSSAPARCTTATVSTARSCPIRPTPRFPRRKP